MDLDHAPTQLARQIAAFCRLIWLPRLSVFLTFCAVLLATMPSLMGLMVLLVAVPCYLVLAVAALFRSVWWGWQRQWWCAATVLISPALPVLLIRPLCWTADVVHLILTITLGLGVVAGTTATSESGFLAYNWSFGLCTGPGTFLLRDGRDEVAKPAGEPRLHRVRADSLEQECSGHSRHLVGHYYVCEF